jgi:UPF0716 family protein affecting phage T7 exclusion
MTLQSTVGLYALRLSAAFLFGAAALHLAAPASAEQLFSRPSAVRAMGVPLTLLGAASLLSPGVVSRVIAVALLVSGVRRSIDPDAMIETMRWASRPVHGVLILAGAVTTMVVAVRTARRAG